VRFHAKRSAQIGRRQQGVLGARGLGGQIMARLLSYPLIPFLYGPWRPTASRSDQSAAVLLLGRWWSPNAER